MIFHLEMEEKLMKSTVDVKTVDVKTFLRPPHPRMSGFFND